MVTTAMKSDAAASRQERYDKPRQCVTKQTHHFADKIKNNQDHGLFIVLYGCKSWTIKKTEHRKIDAFELWCWRRLLRDPWTARKSNQSNQSWIFIGRTDAEDETPILWRPRAKSWLIGKDSDAGRDWGQEDRGWDGWMASPTQWTWVWVNSVSYDGEGGLTCYDSWGCKESDMTERLKWTELNWLMGLSDELAVW